MCIRPSRRWPFRLIVAAAIVAAGCAHETPSSGRAERGAGPRALAVRATPLRDTSFAGDRGPLRDRAIAGAVMRGLQDQLGPLASSIDVSIRGATAVLAGTVSSARATDCAGETARLVVGLASVDNQIRIRAALSPDAVVRRDVMTALANAFPKAAVNLTVEVDHGRAILSGSVPTPAARARIEAAAAGIAGVVAVSSRLGAMMPDPEIPDAELSRALERRLGSLADGAVDAVAVVVQGGHVAFSGAVPSFALRGALIRRAWATPGVRDVAAEHLLVDWRVPVSPRAAGGPGTPEDVQRDVKAILRGEPSLRGLDVQVGIAGDTAILAGEVPTMALRQAAAVAALMTPTIRRVDNQLQIAAGQSDREIAAAVAKELMRDPNLARRVISVQVDHGRVELRGTVDGHFEHDRAASVVSRVAGVRAIVNSLAVPLAAQ
jgi:osmotically-inducible protein OsmY